MPEIIRLTLPYPPSCNRCWRSYTAKSKKTGRSRAITTQSPEGIAYKQIVRQTARMTGIRAPLAGIVTVSYKLFPHRPKDADRRQAKDPYGWEPRLRCIDLDNDSKVLFDALNGIAFEDDGMIFNIHSMRAIPDGEARVEFIIQKYDREF